MPMPMAKLSLQVCLSYGLWSLVSAVHTKVESSDKSNEVVCRDILHIDESCDLRSKARFPAC